MQKQVSPLVIQVKDQETQRDLIFIKNMLEESTGMRISYQNVLNHLIKKYLEEK